jgi:4-amino-4-deoxychorismate lyase
VLKIFWTAGQSERGYRRPDSIHPQRILRRSDWPQKGDGWSALRQCNHRLGENPALAGIKHLNRLDQVVARSEWGDPQTGEGLMLGQDGRVVSGTMSNIFVQRERKLLTPAIDGAGIAGVVRALVLDTAEELGAKVRVDAVSLDDVCRADALFLTNSLIGVLRVSRFESVEYEPGVNEHEVIAETRRLCHQTKPWYASHE